MQEHSIRSYWDLLVWQRGMDMIEGCYAISRTLPDDERFGLSSQLRRASVSIPSNIAEGHGREAAGTFIRQLRISQGSVKEVETLLLAMERLEIADQLLVATRQVQRVWPNAAIDDPIPAR